MLWLAKIGFSMLTLFALSTRTGNQQSFCTADVLPMEFLITIPARMSCWFSSCCRAMSLAHVWKKVHFVFPGDRASRLCDQLQI
jgi:hypothetical protein